ncbi:MAG: DNA starvation/stationary phase protection protein [Calditrichaeota bacterium]|nr:MAG: DNA starvation/stationary phase protection protein [Calditrichota bacterium]
MELKTLDTLHEDTTYTQNVSDKMNGLLASFTVYYQNLRGLHWNISGPAFFQLHLQFETLYNRAAVAIDDIAERILAVNGKPLHTLEDYLQQSVIPQTRNVSDDQEAALTVANNIRLLVQAEKEILHAATEHKDDGTADLMTRLIHEQEKDHWMMRAYLGQ